MSRMAMRWSLEELEDIEAASELPEVHEGEVDVGLPEISADLTEMGDFNELQIEAADELADINVVLDTSVNNDTPLDPVGAQILQIQTESIRRRLGLSSSKGINLSRESFSGRGIRSSNTRLARESVGEMLSNAWEKIKAFFKKMWKKIKDFWKSLFDANVKLRKRAEALKAKATKLSSKDSQDDVSDNGISFSFGGDKFSPGNVLKILTNHKVLLEKSHDIISGAKNITTAIRGTGDDAAAIDAEVDKFIRSHVAPIFSETGDTNTKVRSATGKDDGDIKMSGASLELVDNTILGYAVYPIKNYNNKGSLDGLYLDYIDAVYEDDREANSDDTIEPANKEDQLKICNEVIAIAKALEAMAKNQSKIDNLEKAFDSAFTKSEKAAMAEKEKSSTEGRYAREAIDYDTDAIAAAVPEASRADITAMIDKIKSEKGIKVTRSDTNNMNIDKEVISALGREMRKRGVDPKTTEAPTQAPETPQDTEAPTTAPDAPEDDDPKTGGQTNDVDTSATSVIHASVKTISSVGSFIAKSTSGIMRDGYKAGNKALNYVAKSQSVYNKA